MNFLVGRCYAAMLVEGSVVLSNRPTGWLGFQFETDMNYHKSYIKYHIYIYDIYIYIQTIDTYYILCHPLRVKLTSHKQLPQFK